MERAQKDKTFGDEGEDHCQNRIRLLLCHCLCTRSQNKTGGWGAIWDVGRGGGGWPVRKAGWQSSAFDPFGPDQARLNGLLAVTQCPSQDASLANVRSPH